MLPEFLLAVHHNRCLEGRVCPEALSLLSSLVAARLAAAACLEIAAVAMGWRQKWRCGGGIAAAADLAAAAMALHGTCRWCIKRT